MKIGDYARTDYGTIFKIENMKEIDTDGTWFKSKVKENSIIKDLPRFNYSEEDEIINKTSPNIIDLIEVGDYINGVRVDEIIYIGHGKLEDLEIAFRYKYYFEKDDVYTLKEQSIKSILTREQFERCEYKVGEDNE